jgi:Lsr2 protein
MDGAGLSGADTELVVFAIDGDEYEAVLSSEVAREFRRALDPYLRSARRLSD